MKRIVCFFVLIFLFAFVLGCTGSSGVPEEEEMNRKINERLEQSCGDGFCDMTHESYINCPEDCELPIEEVEPEHALKEGI